MASETSSGVRGAPDAIFGSLRMVLGAMRDLDAISDSLGMVSGVRGAFDIFVLCREFPIK